jgi:hypothetical protein
MNHRAYCGQRFSPLDVINKGNVKSATGGWLSRILQGNQIAPASYWPNVGRWTVFSGRTGQRSLRNAKDAGAAMQTSLPDDHARARCHPALRRNKGSHPRGGAGLRTSGFAGRRLGRFHRREKDQRLERKREQKSAGSATARNGAPDRRDASVSQNGDMAAAATKAMSECTAGLASASSQTTSSTAAAPWKNRRLLKPSRHHQARRPARHPRRVLRCPPQLTTIRKSQFCAGK